MSKVIEKLKNVGGCSRGRGLRRPGTVTTCTVSGASVGYTMLWALVFATVATIIFQEMAARVGIASQKGLGENIRDRIPNPVLKGLAIAIVIIAIFIGNVAYETGNITGGILGIQAVAPGIPMGAIVVVVGLLAAVVMFIGHYNLIEKVLTAIVVFMGVVFLVTALASNPDWGAIVSGMFTPQLPTNNSTGLMTAIGLVGTTIVPYNLFLHASSAAERWKDPSRFPMPASTPCSPLPWAASFPWPFWSAPLQTFTRCGRPGKLTTLPSPASRPPRATRLQAQRSTARSWLSLSPRFWATGLRG